MKNKPDDRCNNVEHIQKNIDMTIHNIELAEEMIAETSDDKMKEALKNKNDRREKALKSMQRESKDEADARRNNYE